MEQKEPSFAQSASAGKGRQVVWYELDVQDWCRPRLREMMAEVDCGAKSTWKETQLGRRMEVRVIAVAEGELVTEWLGLVFVCAL